MIFLPVLSSYFWITPKLPELIIDTWLCLKKQTSKKKQQQQKAFLSRSKPNAKEFNYTVNIELQSVPRRYIAQTHTNHSLTCGSATLINLLIWINFLDIVIRLAKQGEKDGKTENANRKRKLTFKLILNKNTIRL